jgi:adenylylsulfate kinase
MNRPSFAIWVTGLPASGKSTIVQSLKPAIEEAGLTVAVLESDEVRRLLTPEPTYSPAERDLFYRALAVMGAKLVTHGVTVIFDATATKRAYRDFARSLIRRFVEVAVECPLEICMQRDYKGTYRKGRQGEASNVPGLHDPYEPPLHPDVTIDTTAVETAAAVRAVLDALRARSLL